MLGYGYDISTKSQLWKIFLPSYAGLLEVYQSLCRHCATKRAHLLVQRCEETQQALMALLS